jgi:hypothetical protein
MDPFKQTERQKDRMGELPSQKKYSHRKANFPERKRDFNILVQSHNSSIVVSSFYWYGCSKLCEQYKR